MEPRLSLTPSGTDSASLRPLGRSDALYQVSLESLVKSTANEKLTKESWSTYRNSIVSISTISEEKEITKQKASPILDFKLLKEAVFVLFSIASMFVDMGVWMPFTFLPSQMIKAGIKASDASLVISIIGICNMIGRLTGGLATDHPKVGPCKAYITATGIIAVSFAMLPFCSTFVHFAVVAAFYGYCIGLFVVALFPLTVFFFGLDRFSSAMGFLMLFKGIGSLVGPTVLGMVFDATLSYRIPCLIAVGVVFVGIVLSISVTKLHARRQMS